jgi:hypothetical protein
MAGLKPDRKRQAAMGRQAEGVPAARRVVPSARWYRFALAAIILGVLTGFYGTLPAAFVIFHFDNVAAAAHYSVIQDLIALTAFGVLIAGASLTLYVTVRLARRPSVVTSAAGVTVFNWKTVTLPWDNITDVVLTPATRFTRRGWVPGIVQRDGQVLPVAFAEFLPSGGQAHRPAPEIPTSSGTLETSALIRKGLDAHNRAAAHAAGTVPDQAADGAEAGQSLLGLPQADGPSWASDRLALTREWIAFRRAATGEVPWNVIPYAAVSSVRPAADGIAISRPDGMGVVIGKTALTSLEGWDLLAEGLSTNPAVAPAAVKLLQPYLETARLERDPPVTVRHAVDRSGTTHTFCFHRGAHRAFGTFFVIFGVVCLAAAAATPITAGHLGGSWRDEIVVAGVGLLAVWFGVRAFRAGVHIRGEKLTIRDEFRTRKVSAHEIRAITLQSKTMSAAGSHWVPRVDLIDGKSVWITNFDYGPADRPPPPELAVAVAEVRVLLGVRADDIPGPESPQPEDAR